MATKHPARERMLIIDERPLCEYASEKPQGTVQKYILRVNSNAIPKTDSGRDNPDGMDIARGIFLWYSDAEE